MGVVTGSEDRESGFGDTPDMYIQPRARKAGDRGSQGNSLIPGQCPRGCENGFIEIQGGAHHRIIAS